MKEIGVKTVSKLLWMHPWSIRDMIKRWDLEATKVPWKQNVQWEISIDELAKLYLMKRMLEILKKYPNIEQIFLNKIKEDILLPKLKDLWTL